MAKNKTTTLARVEKRFLYWRKTRQKRRPIPDKLEPVQRRQTIDSSGFEDKKTRLKTSFSE